MKHKAVSEVILTLLLTGMLTLTINIYPVKTDPTTIVVPDDYEKIQWALGNASTGDTIFVRAGTYYEYVVVNKMVSLVGEDKETTIIDGSRSGTVINVTVSGVLIGNFTIRNSGEGWYYYGIRVEASRCSIINNKIANSLWGVDLDSSSDSIIFGNNIISNTAPGIRLLASPNVTISGNNITNNIGTGILVYDSANVTISGNNIKDNSGEGVVLQSSANSVVSGNNITHNGGGMKDGYGIYLSSSTVLVESNTITHNYGGLAILGGDNLVKGNNVSNNVEGFYLAGSSARNQIYRNNLVDNEIQVALESSYTKLNVWDRGYPSGGNYWSGYTDVDQYSGPYQNETGSDGIWDHPYVIDENNQDNYPFIPEFPTVAPILLILIMLTVIIAIHKRRLLKTPIH